MACLESASGVYFAITTGISSSPIFVLPKTWLTRLPNPNINQAKNKTSSLVPF